MEDLVAISNEIKDKYNLSFGNSARNGKILIQNNKYKFYLHNQKNSEILKFRCNHYKNPNKNKLRCEAYFTISKTYLLMISTHIILHMIMMKIQLLH